VKILLAAGSHISDQESIEVIDEIMTYVGLGDLSRIIMYVEAGADVNLSWIDSRTPLHMAAGENRLEIVEYFVDLAIKSNSSQNHSPIRSGPEILPGIVRLSINPINLVIILKLKYRSL
jgi:ankyrin repeat protein